LVVRVLLANGEREAQPGVSLLIPVEGAVPVGEPTHVRLISITAASGLSTGERS
jgi:hypothetical protein